MDGVRRAVALGLVLSLVCPPSALVPRAFAQDQAQQQTISNEQIEQLVAPIALYPDSLVAQILMASTYPLEVVEAARWVKANPKVTGQALEDAMQKQSWDASVKSLTAFPQVLAMMDQNLDSTTNLGNAFLAQQADVMSAVQALRAKAQAAGNLKSNEQQTITVEQQPAGAQQQTIIIIQPANPQVVYVPTYNPTTIYGPWPYPSYPPYYYYPPGYAAVGSLISFGVGMAVGSALWGGCNWGSGNVNVNVNNYNNFNRTNISNNNWNHNSVHRKGVQYNNQNVRNQYGKGNHANAKSRDEFRGRAEQGRQDLARGDANQFKGQQGNRGGANTLGAKGAGPHQGNRDLSKGNAAQRGGSANRQASARRDSGAFGGTGNGKQVRQQSSRGQASRQSTASHGGGQRGGGGGHRGGGGGGGGGHRGGGGRR